MADRWLAIRPGSQHALAGGLLAALGGTDGIPMEEAAARTGLTPEWIAATARELREHGPSLVIGEGAAVAALNGLLGAPLVRRLPAPWESAETGAAPVSFEEIANGSLRLAIVDGWATPWETLARKFARGAVVVMLSPFRVGSCELADWLIPAPAVFESLEDALAPSDVKELSWSMGPAIKAAPEGVVEPAEFVARAAGIGGSLEAERRRRVEAIFASRRGSVSAFDGGTASAVKDLESAEKLWEVMTAGACWIDDAAAGEASHWAAPSRLARHSAGPVTPLATKLHQESALWANAAGREKEA
jgi:hypothetical protein